MDLKIALMQKWISKLHYNTGCGVILIACTDEDDDKSRHILGRVVWCGKDLVQRINAKMDLKIA